MEPLFPDLLFLGPYFAPLIIRIGIAIVFLWEAKKLWGASMHQKAHAAWALLLGLLFAVGLFTQLLGPIGIIYIVVTNVVNKEESLFTQKGLVLLMVFALLSLVVTGAGYTPFPFADLPY